MARYRMILKVKEYEVLVQTSSLPQYSFLPIVPKTAIVTTDQRVPEKAKPAVQLSQNITAVDIVFLVDNSGSMQAETRWGDVKTVLSILVEDYNKFKTSDWNGFDIHFLNDRTKGQKKRITDRDSVDQIFQIIQPEGGTPTGARLKELLEDYMPQLTDKSKPIAVITITDGEQSSNDIPLDKVIGDTINKMKNTNVPENKLYFHFIQVGHDKDAARALNELVSEEFEIPDIVGRTLSDPNQTKFQSDKFYEILNRLAKKQIYKESVNANNDHTATTKTQVKLGSTTEFAQARMDWIEEVEDFGVTLNTVEYPGTSVVPYTWMYVDFASGAEFPSNAVICGKQNNKDTFFFRTFYDGEMRYGSVTAGVAQAKFFLKGSEVVTCSQYQVLVQPSSVLYIFAAPPLKTFIQEQKIDIVFLVDDSDSMADGPKWGQASEVLATVLKASKKHEVKEMALHFLNNTQVSTTTSIDEIIKVVHAITPDGSSHAGRKLQQIFGEYIPKLEVQQRQENEGGVFKRLNIIVITDGRLAGHFESVLQNAVQKVKASDIQEGTFGIQFVLVGGDAEALKVLGGIVNEDRDLQNFIGIVQSTSEDKWVELLASV
ncbi:hypothetical protein VKT23_010778 [Stygiomarasmius scandens]|uniref:VWFA domain-containing protein n=1 Tax=Marasmiellus scandens TaxID=2682957 RepID=A0ABR1JDJ1_9AGAR